MNGHDAWMIARLLSDQPVNGEVNGASATFRPLAERLATTPLESRRHVFDGFLICQQGRDEIVKAVGDADPLGPPPPANQGPRFATIADVLRQQTTAGWTWQGFVPSARTIGIAAPEGTGKTRVALDLCRHMWHGPPLTWPDGQTITSPPGTPSLWLCADGHHDEIAETATAFGLPSEAIVFPAPESDPFANTSLDDPDTWKALDAAIATVRPWCLFIDSLTYATAQDISEQKSIARLKTQLVRLINAHAINIALLLHVSKEGQALGRRIKGITRTLIHLDVADPDRPDRLRLWVEKSYAKRPQALGVTIGATGNEYDSQPPPPRDPHRTGRPPKERDEAIGFIRDALARENDQIGIELCRKFEKSGRSNSTFWRAVDELQDSGDITSDGGPGTRRQRVLHLVLPPKPEP